jgi:hypothetical protein
MTTKPLDYIVNTVHTYKPRPDECADLFDAALAQAGLEYKVGWTWVGRCRHGIIYVLDKAGNVVLKQYWERQQTRWSQSDDNLRSCNFGSPKHQALVEVTHNVKALVSANAIGRDWAVRNDELRR